MKGKRSAKRPTKDGKQTWVYRAYHKHGCIFMLTVMAATMFLSFYIPKTLFYADDDTIFVIMLVSVIVVPMIFYHYTTGVDDREREIRIKQDKNPCIYSNADRYPVCCPQCASNHIGPTEDGTFVCMDCGIRWVQTFDA
ncbi:MAG: hypothetical protein J1E37_06465 [Prevotella sp.]|nr:hypothetical protein [Prevotella sp.]